MRVVVLVAVAFLLAGCSDGGDGTPAPTGTPTIAGPDIGLGANNTTAPALPITFELTGCLQFHTFFTYPVAVFENLGFVLPQGFEYASDNGQTVDVLLAWWFCPQGLLNHTPNAPFADVGSMFAAIPVRAPSTLTADDAHPVPVQLDLIPLTWVITSQLAADHLGTIDGLRDGYVEQGDVQETSQADFGAAGAQGAFAAASFGTFQVDLAIQSAPTDNPEGRYRMWLAPESNVVGYLDIVNGPGATRGSGAAELRFQGDTDAGAPPVTAGTGHIVELTDVVVSHVSLVDEATA